MTVGIAKEKLVLAVIIIIVLLLSVGCSSGHEEESFSDSKPAVNEQEAEEKAEQSLEMPPIEVQRNEENDLVIEEAFDAILHRWNDVCAAEKLTEAVLPKAQSFQTYVTEQAVHSDHRTRNYVYAPGDDQFYPIVHFYVSEESGELLEIELSYNEHDYRENTWEIHKEMCLAALSIVMPDVDRQNLEGLCQKVFDQGVENMFPFEQDYGHGAVPKVLNYHNDIGVYPYFATGGRSHFCVIPVDEAVLKSLEKSGTKIEKYDSEEEGKH